MAQRIVALGRIVIPILVLIAAALGGQAAQRWH